jgi:hypothetical protein
MNRRLSFWLRKIAPSARKCQCIFGLQFQRDECTLTDGLTLLRPQQYRSKSNSRDERSYTRTSLLCLCFLQSRGRRSAMTDLLDNGTTPNKDQYSGAHCFPALASDCHQLFGSRQSVCCNASVGDGVPFVSPTSWALYYPHSSGRISASRFPPDSLLIKQDKGLSFTLSVGLCSLATSARALGFPPDEPRLPFNCPLLFISGYGK